MHSLLITTRKEMYPNSHKALKSCLSECAVITFANDCTLTQASFQLLIKWD
jgi:hypothetical protein